MNPATPEAEPGINLPGRPLAPLSATPEERQSLSELAQGGNPRLSRRAAIILACLDGASNRSVARRFRVSKQAVGKWRARFQKVRRDLAGLAQMLNATNPAALRVAVDAVEAAFVAAAGSADLHRKHGRGFAPEIRARNEARLRRARAQFAEARATLTDAASETSAPVPPPSVPPVQPQPRR